MLFAFLNCNNGTKKDSIPDFEGIESFCYYRTHHLNNTTNYFLEHL